MDGRQVLAACRVSVRFTTGRVQLGDAMTSESTNDTEPWKFASKLRAHDRDIRALVVTARYIVTGGRDNTLRLFCDDGTLLGTQHFNSWVLSLAVLRENEVVAGLQDGSCVVVSVSVSGVAKTATWVGHTRPVGSISVAGDRCVSGSWDESARAWDATTGNCIQVLGGHENGVTVLLMRGGAMLVTGSSGRWGDDAIIGVNLRVFARRNEAAGGGGPWELQACRDGAHAAAIRCLVELDGSGDDACFASCSNDGLIHLWSQRAEHVAQLGSEVAPFKYVVLAIGSALLASGDEDGNIIVHGRGGQVATLGGSMPKSWGCAWCAALVPDGNLLAGDLLVGTASGQLVRWTRDAARAAPPGALEKALQKATDEALDEAIGGTVASAAPEGGAALPAAAEREAYEGAREGDVSLFREGGDAVVAFRWSKGSWERVGTVAPTVRRAAKEELDGEYFDRVISIEIDSASKGFLALMLGFNRDDDPAEVARRFCAKYELQDEYIEQIAAYIASSV